MTRMMNRIVENARHLQGQYDKSDVLLRNAMKDAMPWAIQLATRGVIPSIDKLELLATQLIAILDASQKDNTDETPALVSRFKENV